MEREFELGIVDAEQPQQQERGNADLCQYFTPEWAAEFLVETFYGDLSSKDVVVEPTCGLGAWLKALPNDVRAIGVEIDPALAAKARQNTGREVLCGDFLAIDLPCQPTVFLGNPPFVSEIVDRLLDRCHELLPSGDGGRAGFILPAYFVQTVSHVSRWHEKWSIAQTMIPRTLWKNLETPLIFAQFTKERVRKLFGFALYKEAAEIAQMRENFRNLAKEGRPRVSVWIALVDEALSACGGSASLDTIYRCVLPKAPDTNSYPKEKIRQTLQRGRAAGRYCQTGTGQWGLALAA